MSHAGRRSRSPCVESSSACVPSRARPASCCRPTSSRSCPRRPSPARGAPSPWPAPSGTRTAQGERRWSVTPDPVSAPTPSSDDNEGRTTRRATQGGVMHTKRFLALTMAAIIAVAACSNAATPSSAAPSQAPAPTTAGASADAERGPVDPGRVGGPGGRSRRIRPRPSSRASRRTPRSVSGRSGCRRRSTTTSRPRSPASRRPIPGVKVNWEDHQATFQDDLNNSFAAGNAPDVINLSVGEGWVSDYATKDLLLELDGNVPAGSQGHLLRGPLEVPERRRQELPVPVVPGHQRRADQQAHLRGRRRAQARATSPRPSTASAGHVRHHQGKDRRPVRPAPDGQRPARPDGLRG